MVSWAQHHKYEGIYTIVSRPVWVILKRSGWKVKVLKEACFDREIRENNLCFILPEDMLNRASLVAGFLFSPSHSEISSSGWPLMLPVL